MEAEEAGALLSTRSRSKVHKAGIVFSFGSLLSRADD